jgi:hypothetical protein
VQANDALNTVQHSIQLHTHMAMFKKSNVRGQCANTQAQGALDHVAKKKQCTKIRYMAAWTSLQALAPLVGEAGWNELLHLLLDVDMRYMTDMLDNQSEGTRDLSWIWKVPGVLGTSDENLQDGESFATGI